MHQDDIRSTHPSSTLIQAFPMAIWGYGTIDDITTGLSTICLGSGYEREGIPLRVSALNMSLYSEPRPAFMRILALVLS